MHLCEVCQLLSVFIGKIDLLCSPFFVVVAIRHALCRVELVHDIYRPMDVLNSAAHLMCAVAALTSKCFVFSCCVFLDTLVAMTRRSWELSDVSASWGTTANASAFLVSDVS